MNASQKGMRLNEIRHFRQPRPYARKRITKMRLLPDFPVPHGNAILSFNNQNRRSNSSRNSERSRNRCITLDRDQRSREIAWLSYTSDFDESEDIHFAKGRGRNHDTFAETDPELEVVVNLLETEDPITRVVENVPRIEPEVLKEADFEREMEESRRDVSGKKVNETIKDISDKLEKMEDASEEEKTTMSRNESEEMEEVPKNKKETKEFAERTMAERTDVSEIAVEKISAKISTKKKLPEVSRREMEKNGHRNETKSKFSKNSSSESEKNFWWRYESIRRILDFFAHLLGRHGNINREKKAPRSSQGRQRDGTSERNGDTKKTRKSSIQGKRGQSSKKKSTTERTILPMIQQQNRVFSGLTKQIVDIRDEKLRATLFEHEMRSRKLEEENRRYKRILEDKLKTRQMSSPLH